jgi:hypothetical protein
MRIHAIWTLVISQLGFNSDGIYAGFDASLLFGLMQTLMLCCKRLSNCSLYSSAGTSDLLGEVMRTPGNAQLFFAGDSSAAAVVDVCLLTTLPLG